MPVTTPVLDASALDAIPFQVAWLAIQTFHEQRQGTGDLVPHWLVWRGSTLVDRDRDPPSGEQYGEGSLCARLPESLVKSLVLLFPITRSDINRFA